jgi:TonB-dependent receptor
MGLRAALLGSVGLATFAVPAMAQDQSMETVVVTGIRASLQRSLDVKRESAGVVDAISMEDIGKFPDANLAQALMRIPGVTISRAATMGGVATTGQATQITVRGMGPSFNDTLFNGRRIPSPTGGRNFDFSGLSADMVQALEVYKSPDASLSAGAIGATINVKYPNPFDKPGLTISAATSGSYSPDDGRITPGGNFLFSDTFFGGKVGVLVAGAFTKLSSTQFHVSNWGWIGTYMNPCQISGGPACPSGVPVYDTSDSRPEPHYDSHTGQPIYPLVPNPTAAQQRDADNAAFQAGKDQSKPIWFTQDLSYMSNLITEERKNARISVQYQPTEALLVTVDGNYARNFVHKDAYSYAIWNNLDEMRNAKISANGTVVSFQRYAPTDFNNNEGFGISETYDVGINAKYNASNNLTLTFDFDQSLASLSPGDHITASEMDIGYGSSTGGTNSALFEVVQPGGKSLPYYKAYGPNNDKSRFADVSLMGTHVSVNAAQRNRHSLNQFKAMGEWKEDGFTLVAGGSYIADHYRMAYYGPWQNNRWQAWSGYGPDSNNATGVELPASLFHGTKYLPSMPGWDSSNNIPGLPIFSRAEVYEYLNKLGIPTAATGPGSIPGFNWGCCLAGGKTTYQGMDPNKIISIDNGSVQQVFEDSYSLFARFATETKFSGMPVKVNLGVRYEYTSVSTSGIAQPLIGLAVMSGDPTAYAYTMGDAVPTTVDSSYEYVLPNIDVVLMVTDDFQLRFDAARTMTRPNLADLKPNLSGWGGRKGSLGVTGGNPKELPFLSDNIDVAAEWFYAPNSYAAANVFYKSISNFVVGGSSTLVLDGTGGYPRVIDPNTMAPAVFTLSQNVNGPTANVYGIELMWQHMFGDSGFGYQMNGTIVQSDKPYDPNNLTTNAFAITGLADSANFMAFYDKDGFELRLAANWRDTYLNNFGHGQASGTKFGAEPVFVNGVWTLDASTSLQLTDNFKVFFEANNIMNVGYSTRGRFTDQVLDVVAIGRRFTAGIHYKL